MIIYLVFRFCLEQEKYIFEGCFKELLDADRYVVKLALFAQKYFDTEEHILVVEYKVSSLDQCKVFNLARQYGHYEGHYIYLNYENQEIVKDLIL